MIFNINKAVKSLVLIFFIAFATITYITSPVDASFWDIEYSWAKGEITQLESIGVLNGYNDGSFRPHHEISRAEFTKLIIHALEEDQEAHLLSGGDSTFNDVADYHWAKGYILLAQELEIINGRGNDQFDPEAPITREEASAIVVRASQLQEDELEELEFKDNEDIADWALEEIKVALTLGIISGFPDETFKPQDNLIREQAASILMQLMDKKGLLYQFNGIIRSAEDSTVDIRISGKNHIFTVADGAAFMDRGEVIDSLSDKTNTRFSFNVNSQGEIVSGFLHYEDTYYDVNIRQMDDISITAYTKPQTDNHLFSRNFTEPQPKSEENLELSLKHSKQISGINQLQSETGATGEGVTIAVIDTGIDPLHRDLQRTESNSRKILDWVNLSDEGRVQISNTAQADSNQQTITTSEGQVTLPNVSSVSGNYKYGYWYEDWIAYVHDIDFTGSEKTDDKIMVLLVDSKQAGVYDTVFVDTNGNMDLSDEVPLRTYRDNRHSYASFSATEDLPSGFPFILTDIATDGSQVHFGYDSDGHGTHVAGILAGNGKVKGVAPNAHLMAIKVVDSAGFTSEDKIIQAVEYAVNNGADIINISLGHYPVNGAEFENITRRINELAKNRLICIAVGNNGPGLGTLATPGDVNNVLSVGAYISPDLWETDYGWRTETESLWYFNSVGPSADGTLKPDILAPGSAISTYPTWMSSNYYLKEGTSMAAPFVSGAGALLIENMWMSGKPVNSLMVKNALKDSARQLENLSNIEQGFGALDVYKAWEIIQDYERLPNHLHIDTKTTLDGSSAGVFIREYLPGISKTEVANDRSQSAYIEWESQADWININRKTTQIAGNGYRNINFDFTIPEESGLHTGLVKGNIVDSDQKIEILSTLIVPHKYNSRGEYMSYDNLPSGEMKRYYFDVPEDTDSLYFQLRILGILDNLQGRARLHIYKPNGELYDVTNYVGITPPGLRAERELELDIEEPDAGMWEVVVYSSATLSLYDKKTSDYLLVSQIKGGDRGTSYIDNEFIIGAAYKKEESLPDTIVLNIIEAETKQPYTGTLLINDRLYRAKDGKVLVHKNLERNTLTFNIQKVNSN
ncbi:hypothetical protein SYNTR_1853 [Candidatus Syntrophocurvum alkaliphilum]|uniref:SLH domain-containing protein n=1 Tax=Candidatus Syntrophocurvum alkaliphilum TaxID=2293317 RepID=A0A6I6DK81_9FIRM|nr:S8 family serine peptidase [Candidatus Syntrophocurvum alkaliphilum]QGU00447.1 hypothetical protein SYNTR_1853 [Candidatus Syntrophocurvum alkaliphilum]